MEQVRVEQVIAHPVAEVWAVLSSFGGLRGWIPRLESCSLDGAGVGSVRTVTVAGYTVQERLETCDPAAHVISYAVLPPHHFPADDVVGTTRLTGTSDGRTKVEWWCEANVVGSREEFVAVVERLYRASIRGLDRFLAS
ncbi:SRPBCC family protein [Georgenia sp. SYP-B2076]|uniref:SRPBCC family protein n=1 Tax=Georgenia sp. SYP-B2076 TaxID=2495881 RepID=UPI0013DF9889|nr:SRPBCC family protein [Georgenia sp. SYP-B2076]